MPLIVESSHMLFPGKTKTAGKTAVMHVFPAIWFFVRFKGRSQTYFLRLRQVTIATRQPAEITSRITHSMGWLESPVCGNRVWIH